jgi:hypothetical protein
MATIVTNINSQRIEKRGLMPSPSIQASYFIPRVKTLPEGGWWLFAKLGLFPTFLCDERGYCDQLILLFAALVASSGVR